MKECSNCSSCFDDAARFCPTCGNELIASLPGSRDLDGRWRLERVVGVGRQGAVYAASDLAEDRQALVKIFLPTLFFEPGALEAFLEDASRVRKLQHPNAGSTFAAGRLFNGGAYLASEYLGGRSLKRALAEDGPFEPKRAVRIAAALAGALAGAHALGILHRDIKPANIILEARDSGEVARLVDFETSRWTSGQGGSSVTTTGSIVIRMPHYASPEQCRGEEPDARSDIYSLGCVLYEMLAGRVPFDASSPMAVIVKHVTDAAEPPSAHRTGIPEAVEQIVLNTLAKTPGHRPQSGAALAEALREAIGATPKAASTGLEARPALRATAPIGPAPADDPAPAPAPASETPEGGDEERRRIAPPPVPLRMRMTIVDADDESNTSRRIDGVVRDLSENGMRIETGTIETGHLNIIRDHTTAFKNRLELEVELPGGMVRVSGFAAWYRPAPDGVNWNVGVYIRDMPSADRTLYNSYLKNLGAAGT
jgi:serine/threonine protein kinase